MRDTGDVTAVVLAGGKGSRIGRDKALIPLGVKPLVEHVLARVGALAPRALVVTSGDDGRKRLRRLERPGVEVITDIVACGGPLAGIHAGLVASRTDRCVVVGCDMPFLSTLLLAHLVRGLARADAVVPRMAGTGFLEPLAAAYSKSCIPAIERLAASGPVRVARVFDEVQVGYVDEDVCRRLDPGGLSFFNVNTPADLVRAEALVEGCQDGRCARCDVDMPCGQVRAGRA